MKQIYYTKGSPRYPDKHKIWHKTAETENKIFESLQLEMIEFCL